MADAPVTTTAPPAAPAPPAAAPPSQPAPQPHAAHAQPQPGTGPPTPEAPTVDPGTEFYVPDGQGGETIATLQQLANRYAEPVAPTISAEDAKNFDLWKRASANDRGAIMELVKQTLPPEPAAQPKPEELQQKVAALEGKIADLGTQLSAGKPILDGISQLSQQAKLGEFIAANKADVPYLAGHSEGANIALGELKNIERVAAEAKVDLTDASSMRKAIALAMKRANATIEEHAKFYSTFKPVESVAPVPPGSGLVNDQTPDGGSPDRIRARHYQTPDGQWHDRMAENAAAVGAVPGGAPANIPAVVPSSEPAGVSTRPMAPGAPNRGPYTTDQMIANMRATLVQQGSTG